MTIDRRRHGRQIRLAEIGEAGQAKLCASAVELGAAGFARTVEERYVRAAGMRVVDARPTGGATEGAAEVAAGSAKDVAALGLRHAAAREVADGALRALHALRSALAGSS